MKQRDMVATEVAVLMEVVTWTHEDDANNPHKLWSNRWKPHWPKRDGFNVGISSDGRGLFKVRDGATGKWLTFKAHVEVMRHINCRIDPQFAVDPNHPFPKPHDFANNEHVGLQEIRNAKRHVRHGVGCPHNCIDTTPGHLSFGSHAHNMADRGELVRATARLEVPQDIQDIVVALLWQGDGIEAISKRFKLRGWEVRRIADNAGLPHHLSRHDPIDRG